MVAGGAVTAAAVAAYVLPRQGERPTGLDPRLEAHLVAGNFSPTLGERYLRSAGLPAEDAFESLVRATAPLASSGNIGDVILQRTRADFKSGQTCRLDGWELSLTECRLAALAFLLAQAGIVIERAEVGEDGPLDHLPDIEFGQLHSWGPKSSTAGEGFNVQPNGNSALWFRFQKLGEYPGYRVYFGATEASTNVKSNSNLITASLTPAKLAQSNAVAGNVPIHLVDPVRGKQLLAHFSFEQPPTPGAR